MNAKKILLAVGGVATLVAGYLTLIPEEKIEPKYTPIQEIKIRAVGDEIVSMRKSNMRVQKTGENKFKAEIYAKKSLYFDNEDSTYKKIDISVKEISALAKLDPTKTHDKYIDAGRFQVTWFEKKPNDYKFIVGDYYVKYKALFDTTGILVKTIPKNYGIKQEITLKNDKAANELRWLIDTNTRIKIEKDRIVFQDENEKPQFISPQPSATGSENIWYPLYFTMSGDTLIYRNESKNYPITIDPTTTIPDVDLMTGNLATLRKTYAVSRDTTDAQYMNTNMIEIQTGTYTNGAFDNRFYRILLRFDTSGLTDGVVIDSVKSKVIVYSDASTTNFYLHNVETIDTLSTIHFTSSMFSKFEGRTVGSAHVVIDLSESLTTNGISLGDTLTFKFNTAGKNEINKTGITQFFLISGFDIGNVNTTTTDNIAIEDDSPYLQVWYTEAANLKVNGIEVTKVNGSSYAKVNGVAP